MQRVLAVPRSMAVATILAIVGSALVMEHDTLIGIFTERDILHALKRNPAAALESPVSRWMTRGSSS